MQVSKHLCRGYFIFDITNFLEARLCTTYFSMYVQCMYTMYVYFIILCLLVFVCLSSVDKLCYLYIYIGYYFLYFLNSFKFGLLV